MKEDTKNEREKEKEKMNKFETLVNNMSKKIEAQNTIIGELKTESGNRRQKDQDQETVLNTLFTKVESQNTMIRAQNSTIKGLITGSVDLKDTSGIQEKLCEVAGKPKSGIRHSHRAIK